MHKIASATGHCLCGAVRYTAHDVEAHYHICHCGMCLRYAGAPTMSVMAGRAVFENEAHVLRYRSSEWAERGSCRACGGHLFYHLFQPDLYAFNLGTLDDTAPYTLSGEIYIDHKPASYAFAGDHRRETEAEVLKRFGVTE
jgi:hypothetical protein